MVSVRDRLYLIKTDKFSDSDAFLRVYESLSRYRQRKISRYKHASDKMLSAAAGFLIDAALKEYGLRERDMDYIENAYGKPYFKDYPDIFFNVSHSGNYALCAISDTEIGCDAECIRKRQTEKIARRVLTDSERAVIKASGDSEREFIRFWTRKESLLKASGLGICGHLTQNDTVSDCVLHNGKKYCFTEYSSVPKMCVTVCREDKKFTADITELS